MRFEPIEDITGFTLEGIDTWLARIGNYSFVITKDGREIRASWKDATFQGPQSSNFIGAFKGLQQAETACRQTYKQLLRKH